MSHADGKAPAHIAVVLWLILIQSINAASSSVALSTNRNPNVYGAPITLTAIVSPPSATGKVTFYDGVVVLGIASVVSGSATLTTVTIPSGPRSLKAHYSGDSSYSFANSATYVEMINAVPGGGFLPFKKLSSTATYYSTNIVVADFNGDGKQDIARVGNGLEVLLGNGDGTFVLVPNSARTGAADLAAGDFNGDGKIDLLATGLNSITVALGNGDGTFRPPFSQSAGPNPGKVALADFNGDGIIDLAIQNASQLDTPDSNTVAIYLGKGDGTFSFSTNLDAGKDPVAIVAGDFNADGFADLAIQLLDEWRIAGPGHIAILLGKGDGTFAPAVIYAPGGSIAVADFTGDGRLDLAVAGISSLTILAGNGDGTFNVAASNGPTVVPDGASLLTILDFNGDGRPDLFAFGYNSAMKLLANKGGGVFSLQQTLPWSGYNFAFAAGDFNGDGIADLVLENGIMLGTVPVSLESQITPNGTIQLGQLGATFSIIITNVGSISTQGATTATYKASTDFSFVTMSGLGWTCTYFSAQCQRDDALAPGQSYPPILVTVNVSATAMQSEAHSVTLSTVAGATDTTIESASVAIAYPPPFDLAVAINHSGIFQTGQYGVTSMVVVSNLGPNASFGVVTVTVNFSNDFSYINLAGPGWNCTGPQSQCQRSDSLPSGQDYPPITVTANVSGFAAPFVTTGATVSNFLDTNPANNTAGDTVIVFHMQSIGFGLPPDRVLEDSPFLLTAVASSGLPVTYTASGNCSVAGSTVTLLSVGSCAITASQSGNVAFAAAPAVQRSFRILTDRSGVTLSAGSDSSIFGAHVTLAAAVSPASASGAVAFYDGATVLGTAPVLNGIAAFSPPLNATGRRTLRAHYTGDANYPGSTSAPVSHLVTAIPSFTFTFSQTTPSFTAGGSTVVGDLNGDGWPDIISNEGVRLNNGDGTFGRAISLPLQVSALALADFNGDGRLDLVVTAAGSALYFLSGKGDGTFGAPVRIPGDTGPLIVADFNMDGFADLGVIHTATGSLAILLGNGDGTFLELAEFVVGAGLTSISIGDVNGDGNLDLVTVLLDYSTIPQDAKIVTLIGNGDGSFQALPVTLVPTSGYMFRFALDDLNGDGNLDLIVGINSRNAVGVLLGNGDGTFGSPLFPPPPLRSLDPFTILSADFDGDGNQDVILLQTSPSPLDIELFAGNGDGTLQSPAAFNGINTSPSGTPVPITDLNGDGRVDFVVNSVGGMAIIQGAPGPSLRVSVTHGGNFTQAQTGAAFTIVVDNAPGAGTASGVVTVNMMVSPTVSPTFTPTGSGWSCSLNSCMRSDPLLPGASYPPIVTTFDAPAYGAGPVDLSATVLGGGSFSRTAMDSANIVPRAN